MEKKSLIPQNHKTLLARNLESLLISHEILNFHELYKTKKDFMSDFYKLIEIHLDDLSKNNTDGKKEIYINDCIRFLEIQNQKKRKTLRKRRIKALIFKHCYQEM